jgi:ERCC4-type nuclease
MQIVVDSREQALYTLLKTSTTINQHNVDIKPLEIGDVLIHKKDSYKILIERKTVSDLAGSIKDGRYNEQSFRLNEFEGLSNHHIYYLIEGPIKSHDLHLYSAMFSLSYYKGFSLLRTKDIHETAILILSIANKLEREEGKREPFKETMKIAATTTPSATTANTTADDADIDVPIPVPVPSYCTVMQKSKKSNCIKPDNFGEIVLCQIPGVSSVTAVAIMEHYKKFQNLLDDTEKETTLKETIKMTKTNKKISKTVVENILLFLKEW